MATVTIRNLDNTVVRLLKERAAANDRSMEAEIRALITSSVAGDSLARDWVVATADLRGDDLPVPPRSAPREVSLS